MFDGNLQPDIVDYLNNRLNLLNIIWNFLNRIWNFLKGYWPFSVFWKKKRNVPRATWWDLSTRVKEWYDKRKPTDATAAKDVNKLNNPNDMEPQLAIEYMIKRRWAD